jgi:hypothetical protein
MPVSVARADVAHLAVARQCRQRPPHRDRLAARRLTLIYNRDPNTKQKARVLNEVADESIKTSKTAASRIFPGWTRRANLT